MSRARVIFGANVREALRSLALAKQRTALGVIGIVIGIGSVIAMISVGLIAKSESLKEFEALGTDVLVIETIRSSSGADAGRFPVRDVMRLAADVPSLVQASPRLKSSRKYSFAGRRIGSGEVHGVTSSFAGIVKLELDEGRFVSDLDGHSFYCTVGADVAEAMRKAGATRVVGETIKLGRHRYTVVGVLASTPERDALSLNMSVNRSFFVPVWNAKRVFSERGIRQVVARSHPDVHYTVATDQIISHFKRGGRRLAVSVDSATQLIEQMEKQMQLLSLLLGTIGSISLIVGGIGIMNIMMASIAERKKEIGLRRALGAHRRDIQSQFLIETVILCLLGGVLGTVVGVGGTYAVCHFVEWDFFVSWSSVALGIGVSSAVGIFFGFQPAYQAARLDPIAALHSE